MNNHFVSLHIEEHFILGTQTDQKHLERKERIQKDS